MIADLLHAYYPIFACRFYFFESRDISSSLNFDVCLWWNKHLKSKQLSRYFLVCQTNQIFLNTCQSKCLNVCFLVTSQFNLKITYLFMENIIYNIVVRFLALVTTMVTKVDHSNQLRNDCNNYRSNYPNLTKIALTCPKLPKFTFSSLFHCI